MLAFKGFTGGHHPPHPHVFFFYCLQYEKSTWPVKWNGPQPCREMSLPQRTSGLKFKGLPENKGVRRHFHIFIRSYWFPMSLLDLFPSPTAASVIAAHPSSRRPQTNQLPGLLCWAKTPQLQTGKGPTPPFLSAYGAAMDQTAQLLKSIKHQEMGRWDFVLPDLPPDNVVGRRARSATPDDCWGDVIGPGRR